MSLTNNQYVSMNAMGGNTFSFPKGASNKTPLNDKTETITRLLMKFFHSGVGHIVMFILHIVSCIAIIVIGALNSDKGLVDVYYTRPFFKENQIQYEIQIIFGDVNLFFLNSAFLGITAFFHFSYMYNHFLAGDENISIYVRWIEYSITASIMIIIIALLSGIREIFTLMTTFGLMAITMAFGFISDYSFETINEKPVIRKSVYNAYVSSFEKRSPNFIGKMAFFVGFVPYIFAWVPIFVQFYSALAGSIAKPPDFVYAVIVIMFLLFSTFAGVQLWFTVLFETNGTNEIMRYFQLMKQDAWLHILSLIAKLTLSWMVTGGIINTT